MDPLNCASLMSTPLVVEMGRAYFNCSTHTGVEIENNDGGCFTLGMCTVQAVSIESQPADYLVVQCVSVLSCPNPLTC